MISIPNHEKRHGARVRFDAPASVEPVPVPTPEHMWRLLAENISEDGMRLSSPNLFPVKSRLRLNIDIGRPAAPIRAIGRVVWAEQHANADRWEIGVEFSELSDNARYRLREIIACPSSRSLETPWEKASGAVRTPNQSAGKIVGSLDLDPRIGSGLSGAARGPG